MTDKTSAFTTVPPRVPESRTQTAPPSHLLRVLDVYGIRLQPRASPTNYAMASVPPRYDQFG